ncbi:MAG: exonuclease [Gammaproteobacteria bacterium]|jgi:DNA polymerase-3 subunit epsilon|nr:MAG: exonuclease [Gammaproteobacteria bacterium]
MRFAAIDFETANYSQDSACAVGLVVVDGAQIVDRAYHLIRPPTTEFKFTHIHGLTWTDVCNAKTFAELWPELRGYMRKIDFLAAHNAPFDRGVLAGCCTSYGLSNVRRRFVCTVQVAREVWSIYPTKLPDVCRSLSIPLQHHRADSDAEACARIVMAAMTAGWMP